jgi:acetyltransferase-like isoleucine patch superfamily enzyme
VPGSARKLLSAVLVVLAHRSGWLLRAMKWRSFRRLLDPAHRGAAWRLLGASIDETAIVGPRVWMRNPANVTIGAGSRLGGRVWIDSWGEVTIGRNVLMNGEIDLFCTQHLLDHPRFRGERHPISIGDYVWLPWKVVVMPGVRIGNYAVIGTGSVVTNDVPDYAVAAGNPARVVKQRAHIDYTYVPTTLEQPPPDQQ